MMKAAKSVDGYIASAPRGVQAKLKELRALIKKTAPLAQEKISYGVAYYAYKGRLVYFGIAKTHIGLYIPTPVIENHAKELAAYSTSKATIRLPIEGKLPAALIRKLVKARMKLNEGAKKK